MWVFEKVGEEKEAIVLRTGYDGGGEGFEDVEASGEMMRSG